MELKGAAGEMVRVHLSDGSFLLLHAEAAARFGLAAGSELDEEQRRHLVARSERIRARITALRLLSRSAHSQRGLEQKLAARGFDRAAIRHALARMVELGYCDDRAFAESWAGLRLSRGSIGATALYRGLIARGVPKPLAQEVVSGMFSHEAELESARRVAAGLSRAAAIRRLRVRGFRSRAIAAVLREIPGTAHGPAAD